MPDMHLFIRQLKNRFSLPCGASKTNFRSLLFTLILCLTFFGCSTNNLVNGEDCTPNIQYNQQTPPKSAQSKAWKKKKNIPVKLMATGAFTLNKRIYVLGGDKYIRDFDVLYEYNPSTDIWTKKSHTVPKEGSAALTISMDDKIYTFGGYYIESMEKWHKTYGVQEYEPASDKWILKNQMSEDFNGLAAAGYKGKIYILGNSIIKVYDPESNSFSDKTTSFPGICQGAFNFNDKIFAFFGQFKNNLYEYNPETDKWTHKADMLVPRIHLVPAVVGNKFYAIGGIASDEQGRNNVEQYDLVANKFISRTSAPYGFWGAGITVRNGKVYLLGGITDSGFENCTNEFYEYDPTLD